MHIHEAHTKNTEEKGDDAGHDLLLHPAHALTAALQILTSKPHSIFSLFLLWTTVQPVHKSLVYSSPRAQRAEERDQDSEMHKTEYTAAPSHHFSLQSSLWVAFICWISSGIVTYSHNTAWQNPSRTVDFFNIVLQIRVRTDHPALYVQDQTPLKVHVVKKDEPLQVLESGLCCRLHLVLCADNTAKLCRRSIITQSLPGHFVPIPKKDDGWITEE